MKALKNSTIFYSFKCDGTLISFKLKSVGRLLNLVGASNYFEVPVSHIHNFSTEISGPYYILDLKVNSYTFSGSDTKFRHMRLYLLRNMIDQGDYEELVNSLNQQTSYDMWDQSFYNSRLRVAEA